MFLFMEKIKRIALGVLLGSMVVGGVALICAEASADDLELRVLADVQHQHTDGGVIVLGQEHRPHIDAVVSTSLFSLDLSLRPRVEYRVEGDNSVFRIRKELRVEFSEIPTTPFISDEVFVSTSGDIQRNKISVGLSPLEGLSTFYSLETDFNDVTEYRNIVGVDYRFNP